MPPRKLLPAALASALLFAAPAAFAQTREAQGGEHQTQAGIAAFAHAKQSLTDAVSAAETHSGGRALDAAFDGRHGTPVYDVKTYRDGKVWEGRVDAASGKIVGEGKTIDEAKLDQEDKAELAALKTAKTTLGEAVQAAERKTGGKAIDAGLEERGGKVAYEIQTVKDGGLHQVTVDPQSGQVAAAAHGRSTESTGSSTPGTR